MSDSTSSSFSRRTRARASGPTPSTPPDVVTAGAPDPYARQLPPGNLKDYQDASDEPDLSREIRLMRAILAHLSANIDENHPSMFRAIQALLRALDLQGKHAGAGEAGDALDRAAERLLDEAQSRGPDGDAPGPSPASGGTDARS